MNDKLLGVILYIIFAIVIIAFIIYKVKTETPEKKKARQREMEAFKANQEKKKQEKKQNIITCPNCHSKNVTFLQQDKKAFSVGKAAAGAVLTGGVGTLAGFTGKKGNKQWHCQNCGNMFETK